MNLLKLPGKDPVDNMEWRLELRRVCAEDAKIRAAVRTICREDPIYFFNAFCWLYEPRPRFVNGKELPKVIPFVTWPHQDKVVREIVKHLGKRDIGIEKSRAEGASWIGVLLALQNWIFKDMTPIGVVSRNLLTADNPSDPDSISWKLIWQLSKLPMWMVGKEQVDWRYDRSKHTLNNLRNGSTITSYAATGDVGTGGRKAWFLAQPVSCKVATPSGWSRMGELRVGDVVLGKNGRPCSVTAVHEHGVQDVYRIEFSDGSSTRSTLDHMWQVITSGNRCASYRRVSSRRCKWGETPYRDRWVRLPLSEIIKDYARVRPSGNRLNKYHIPVCSPVDFVSVELPLDPYLVGAWIGDGYANGVSFASVDQFILDTLSDALPGDACMQLKGRCIYRPSTTESRAWLRGKFKDLDMMRVGENKQIPEVYKRADVWSRLRLLQGLMDTDGTTQGRPGKPKNHCSLTTISPQLASDVVEVVQSLGGYAKVVKIFPWCTYGGVRRRGKDAYKVTVSLPPGMCPFSLPRKVDRWCEKTKYQLTRAIVDISKVEPEECRCITVDAEDHLYLTDDFIVTSNCDEVSKWPAGLDEEAMASTQHVTDCRLVVSTPKGASGAYYEMMHEPSNLVKLTLAWEDNPTKNRGLYKFVRGKPVAIDPKHNNIPKSYSPPNQETQDLFSRLRKKGFNLQTGVRSPWYDQECDRPRATPQAIAQELDRDYGGSSYRIFTHEVMAQIQKTSTKPLLRGELLTSDDQTLFEQRPDGQMGLWCQLDLDGKPPERGYVIGCDIGAGLGGSYTSNSVIQVIDGVTRNQVLEFASNTMQPAEFADLAISVAKWFHNAYLAWEANGIGGAFGARVLEQRYANVFRKPIFNQKKKVVSNKLGWWTSKDTKEQLFSDMIIAIKQDRLTVRSAQLIDEMNQYIRVAGKIECMASLTSKSDADKGEAHGDRVMALGIALQALKDRPIPLKLDDPTSGRSKEPPLGTMARRLWEAAQKSKEDDGWDDRLVSDMRGRRA